MTDAVFVYVMAAKSSGPCKIGISKNPKARLSGVQTGHPEKLKLWLTEEVESPDRERQIHSHFSAFRLMGEWFNTSVKQIAEYIASGFYDPPVLIAEPVKAVYNSPSRNHTNLRAILAKVAPSLTDEQYQYLARGITWDEKQSAQNRKNQKAWRERQKAK